MTGEAGKPAGPATGLDPEFLEMLDEISVLEGISSADMVDRIDRMRGDNSRASAVRVFVLKYFQTQAGKSRSQPGPAAGGDHSPVIDQSFEG